MGVCLCVSVDVFVSEMFCCKFFCSLEYDRCVVYDY